MDITTKLHMHVWSKDNEDIEDELDLEYVGTYCDGYLQFGADLNGRYVELHIPPSMIPKPDK